MTEEPNKTDAQTEADAKPEVKTEAASAAKPKPAATESKSAPSEPVAGVKKGLSGVTSWWGRRSKKGRLGIIVGGVAAVVLVAVAIFLVLFFRPSFVVALETEEAVVSGDDVVLVVEVSNDGRTGGECELRAQVEGETVQTERVPLEPGEDAQVEFTLSGLAPGHYDIGLAGWAELTQNVWVMTPAKFEVGEVSIQPEPFDINTTTEAEIAVPLANVGEAPGTYALEVSLDGEVLENREVELQGGTDSTETFAVKVTEPGTRKVTVNDHDFDVEVYQFERPDNGQIVVREGLGQYNRVEIKNNDDLDCIVVMNKVGEEGPFLIVYVHAQSECTVKDVLSGTYTFSYTFGEDWCAYREAFTKSQRDGQFDESVAVKSGMQGLRIDWHGVYSSTVNYTAVKIEIGGSGEESLTSTEESFVRSQSVTF